LIKHQLYFDISDSTLRQTYEEHVAQYHDYLAIRTLLHNSGDQTVARKALWSGPRSNLQWKENFTL